MSVTSAKSGATGISLALDNNYMEPIATTVVGSTAVNSIIFNDIPQGYKHLQLRMFGRTTRTSGNDGTNLRFNGDASASYSEHELKGSGTAVSVYGYASDVSAVHSVFATDGGYSASIFGAIVLDILDYSNTNKYKTVRSLGGADNNGTGTVGGVYFDSSCWQNLTPITSIYINSPTGSNFVQYSRFSLYGIKG